MHETDIETEPVRDEDAQSAPRARRRRWRGPLLGFLGTLTLLAAVYIGGAYYLSTKVPANAVVGGVDVGGTSPEEARSRVESAVAKLEAEPVVVTVEEGQTFELDPDRSGLRIDTEKTLSGLTRFTLDPRHLYEHLSGSTEREFILDISKEDLAKAVTAAAEPVEREPVEGTVALVDRQFVIEDPTDGLAVDIAATTEAVAAAWPHERQVTGVSSAVPATTPPSVFAEFRSTFADTALSAPLTVAVGEDSFTISSEAVADALSVSLTDSVITTAIDEEALAPAIDEAATEAGVVRPARDATVTFSGTEASVEPSQTGVDLDVSGQSEAILAALTAEDRTLQLEPVITQPELTTEEAQATLPKERISSFTSEYSPAPRANNIKIAARAMNGTYVPPGGTFSLNQVLGQRTPEAGYVKAGTIVNNRLVDNYGGGVSQVSTAVYNAAYFAGVQIDEFMPHSYYISRYPEGREATLSWGTIDNRWTNNTDGGILVRSWADDYSITVELWGTKTFDVETIKSPRSNIVQPPEIVDASPSCLTQNPMVGFDVTVTRIISQNGTEIKREPIRTRYVPQPKVICTNPNAG
ncbi:MAG: VanW family protein [Actinomycetia bacterium]|nr:VanW family protein [Actinomycetes bacterium]